MHQPDVVTRGRQSTPEQTSDATRAHDGNSHGALSEGASVGTVLIWDCELRASYARKPGSSSAHMAQPSTHSAPSAGAAYNKPRTDAPPMLSAIAGKSAAGIPKNIATISTRYVPISSGCERANAHPSRTPRRLGRWAPAGGGDARINHRATSD